MTGILLAGKYEYILYVRPVRNVPLVAAAYGSLFMNCNESVGTCTPAERVYQIFDFLQTDKSVRRPTVLQYIVLNSQRDSVMLRSMRQQRAHTLPRFIKMSSHNGTSKFMYLCYVLI